MNWSFSSLMMYESCPYRFKLAKIDKLPRKPLPPDNPMERGNRIHGGLERYVKGETAVLVTEARGMDKLQHVADRLRELYACDMATVEQDWLFNRDWDEAPKRMRCSVHDDITTDGCAECETKVWLWAKLDTCGIDIENKLVVPGDWKSGKSQYKAVEHVQQLQLYSAVAALKYPWAETIIPELYYVDEGHIRSSEYTREQALSFVGRFDVRAQRIFDDKFYRPNPNVNTCRYCDFGPRNGTGACAVGV